MKSVRASLSSLVVSALASLLIPSPVVSVLPSLVLPDILPPLAALPVMALTILCPQQLLLSQPVRTQYFVTRSVENFCQHPHHPRRSFLKATNYPCCFSSAVDLCSTLVVFCRTVVVSSSAAPPRGLIVPPCRNPGRLLCLLQHGPLLSQIHSGYLL